MANTHMEVTRQHQVYDTPEGRVERVATESDYRPSKSRTAANVVYTLAGIITALLAIRFVLSLLGANQASAFGSLMYAVTEPLVMPFYGLFGTKAVYGQSRLELETVVAIIIYALLAWGIIKILLVDRTRPEA